MIETAQHTRVEPGHHGQAGHWLSTRPPTCGQTSTNSTLLATEATEMTASWPGWTRFPDHRAAPPEQAGAKHAQRIGEQQANAGRQDVLQKPNSGPA